MFSRLFRFFGCYPIPDNHKRTFDEVTSRRHCTNFVWLVIFVAFLIGLVFLGFYATRRGDIKRYIYAMDSFGNRCGMKNSAVKLLSRNGEISFPKSGQDFRTRPFSMPMEVNNPDGYAWHCVPHCPRDSFYILDDLAEYMEQTRDNTMCSADVSLPANDSSLPVKILRDYFTNVGPCARPPIYKSRPVLNRCLPKRVAELPSAAISNLKSVVDDADFLRHLFADFYSGRYVFLAVIIVSFVLSIYITYQMIYNNHQIVYAFYVTTMPCGIVCSVVLLCICLYSFVASFFLETKFLGLPSNFERFVNGYRVDYVLMFVLFLLVTLFTLISWTITWTIFVPRHTLVAELFFQARKPLKCMLWLVVETFFNCVFSLVLFGFWIYGLLNLLSAEQPEWYTIATQTEENPFADSVSAIRIVRPWWMPFALVYHGFALLWIKSFLSDAQKIFVAQATSTWYFGENRKSQWSVVFCRSVYILICYHLGTVAFGSLVLLFVRLPSHVFLFIYYRIAKSKREGVVNFYGSNFIWLSNLERVLRYIHSNAYAIVATSGEDFLAACKTATNLWIDNSWYLLTTNTVAMLLFRMTTLTFSLTIAFFTGLYFRWYADAEYWLWPTLMCALLAHFVLNRFLALHQMIIETMFLCYASEIDGYDSRAQFNGLPRKADYGFNYYMARRIYEERRLNFSLGFSISAISGPSPASNGGIHEPRSGSVPFAAYESSVGGGINYTDSSAALVFQNEIAINNNRRDQIVRIFRNLTSTPL